METAQAQLDKKDTWAFSATLFITILFMLATNPREISVQLLLVLPVLVGLLSYYFIKIVTGLFTDMESERRQRLSFVLATGPTIMIVLGSLHQLGIQDVALASLFVAGLGWYLRRNQPIVS